MTPTLEVSQTTRAYTGRPGCMCGCLGVYHEGLRARKLAITQLLKNPQVRLQAWDNDAEGCVYLVTDTRSRALYLTPLGIRTVRAMGIVEEK